MQNDFHHNIDLEQGSWKFTLARQCEHNLIHGHTKPHVLTVLKGRVLVHVFRDDDTNTLLEPPKSLGPGASFMVLATVRHMVKAEVDGTEYECDFGDGTIEKYNASLEAVA